MKENKISQSVHVTYNGSVTKPFNIKRLVFSKLVHESQLFNTINLGVFLITKHYSIIRNKAVTFWIHAYTRVYAHTPTRVYC